MLITGISTGISISGLLLLIILYAYLKAIKYFFSFCLGYRLKRAHQILFPSSSSLKYSVSFTIVKTADVRSVISS